MIDIDKLDFEKMGGVVTVVTQDAVTGSVLMVAQADREALEKTIATGEMYYRSRTRGLWRKGETSGNIQKVVSLTPDCDGDTVLARVNSAGPACHTNATTCFDNNGNVNISDALAELAATIELRANSNEGGNSYTQKLLADRNLRLKKIGEEAAEFVTACADGNKERATEEGADLLYHILVALRSTGVTLRDVQSTLARRAR